MKHKTVCVVGLGYVGLPLGKAFSKHLKTIGFDIDDDLNNNNDNIEFTSDPSEINGGKGDFTEEHKEMPEFADENVRKIFLRLTKSSKIQPGCRLWHSCRGNR